jgi:drug/metabolite transporter (DMT)-like permease
MTMSVALVVLGAGVMHAVWNALLKHANAPFASFTLLNLATALTCSVLVPIVGLPPSRAFVYVAASVGCHTCYEIFLMRALHRGDFSQSYPIARGVAPLLVALGGFALAGQHLGATGVIGVAIIVVGVASLALYRGNGRSIRHALPWAIATGIGIATYSVIDGMGVRHAHNAIQYGVTLLAIQASLWSIAVIARSGLSWWPRERHVVSMGLVAGVMSVCGYILVLWAQQRAPFAVVSALRETSVLWAALIGALVFKEGRVLRLVAPALVVVVGILFLAWA